MSLCCYPMSTANGEQVDTLRNWHDVELLRCPTEEIQQLHNSNVHLNHQTSWTTSLTPLQSQEHPSKVCLLPVWPLNPILCSATHTVASHLRHQYTVAPLLESQNGAENPEWISGCFSQSRDSLFVLYVKIELFNAQSLKQILFHT